MKTTLGVGIAVLSALAARGNDFYRATLDAMLDRLAASPEPKIKPGPMACCYKMAEPRPVECRHVCTKCGTVTRYVSTHLSNTLAFLRDGAVELKGRGLDIALDESALCRACSPGPKMPRTGRIVAATDEFAAGDAVNILHQQGTFAVVVPQKRGLWVAAKFVDREKSCVTADSVRVRMLPTTNGRIVARLNRGHKVEILPAEAGDPVDWVRLEHAAYGLEDRGVLVEMKNLKDLAYGDGDFALDTRIKDVAWVINGKRTLARRTDVELLKTFLSGKLILKEGRFDEKIPLKRRLARLRELLGEPKK